MIKIDFSDKKIRVETKIVSSILKIPLKLSIQSHVTKNEIWSSQLNDGWWAEFPNNEMNDAVVTDYDGVIVAERKWDIIQDGNELYKSLYFYCLNIFSSGRTPKGIAVGTHDGLFGEWVPCVLKGITDSILVEASKPQFEKLEEVYSQLGNVKLINSLITTDGKPVEFFEGGRGYTNSIVERVIKDWETEEISSTIKSSISVNDLIVGKIDWIHTDVEGYDAKLLMGIDPEKLPNLIIFEYENLESDENEILKNYLINLDYLLEYHKVSCIAIKK
jgi:hypothetical protein